MHAKIAILGAGHVGSHVGRALAAGNICDEIVLIDRLPEKAAAQAMDIADALSFPPSDTKIRAGDHNECADADITIFDPGTISDTEDWTELRDPVGIVRTYIAGKLARDNGITVNDRLGRFIPYQGGK